MKSCDKLTHIKEYISQENLIPLEDCELQLLKPIKRIRKFKALNEGTKGFEVGTSMGWFPILISEEWYFL